MANQVSAGVKDAAFVNDIIRKLEGSNPVSRPLEIEIQRAVDNTHQEGFVTDEVFREAYKKATGKKPEGPLYERMRADLFMAILCKRLYTAQNDHQMLGTIGDTMHLLATDSLPSLDAKNNYFDRQLGGPVWEVDIDTTNDRIYLRTADCSRGEYMPGEGIAVIYHHENEYELELPSGEKINLSERREQGLVLPSERKEREAALKAVKELLVERLSLPVSKDPFVRLNTDLADRSKEERAYGMDVLKHVSKSLGVKTPSVRAKALGLGDVAPDELGEQAKKLIASFRDGELNFFTGRYADAESYDLRKEARDNARANVMELVGWLSNDRLDNWATERFSKGDRDDQASVLLRGLSALHPEAESFAKLERESLKKAPEVIRPWIKANIFDPQTLISFGMSIAGPHRQTYGKRLEGIERVKIDGQLAGYVVTMQYYGYEGDKGRKERAALNLKGELLGTD
jgi:hypothetical protein